MAQTRATQRKARVRRGLARIALVGYTNAGKSTLLNRLTHSDALVEDQLFSTLDPTTRRLRLPGGEMVLVSDTVGFVQRLPHQLVEAFRSTLEEVVDADLLLHVVDASRPEVDARIAAVHAVLAEIGAGSRPDLMVWNKCDLAPAGDVDRLLARCRGSVAVSGATGERIEELRVAIAERLRSLDRVVELAVPYDRGDVLAALHRDGEVLVEVHDDDGTRVRARLSDPVLSRFRGFVTAKA